MLNFWNTIWNMVNTKVGVAIITAIISVVATMIGQIVYLKIKQRVGFEKIIGDKIANALDTVRDIELSTKAIEIYGVDELLEENEVNIDFFEQQAYYPAIMASPDVFRKFYDKVSKARGDCEKYLNHNIAAYLYYIERYCINVMRYVGQNSIPLAFFGTMILFDFQKWQEQYDEELVILINKPQYKVYSHNGSGWEQAKKKVMDKLWKKSILYKLMNDDESPEILAAKAILSNDPQTEKLVDQLK